MSTHSGEIVLTRQKSQILVSAATSLSYRDECSSLGTCEYCQLPNKTLRTEESQLPDDYFNQNESVVCDGCQGIFHLHCIIPWRNIDDSPDFNGKGYLGHRLR